MKPVQGRTYCAVTIVVAALVALVSRGYAKYDFDADQEPLSGEAKATTAKLAAEAAKDLQTITRQPDRQNSLAAIAAIAVAQATGGDFAGAKATAASIEDENLRWWAFNGIVKEQAFAGDIGGAKATAARMAPGGWKSDAYRAIAKAQARNGDIAGARLTADQIEDSYSKAQAYFAIGKEQMRSGDRDGAEKTFGIVKAAVKDLQNDFSRTQAYEAIAAVEEEAGHVAAANGVLEKIRRDEVSLAHFDIARRQTDDGDLAGAKVSATKIEDINYRVRAYLDIAAAQVKSGDPSSARETLLIARTAASRLEDPRRKAEAYRGIARGQFQAGDVAGAKDTAAQTGDADRDGILSEIVKMQAQRGDMAGALATTDEIKLTASKAWALQYIVEAYAKTGRTADAKTTAAQIENPGLQATAYGLIADAQARAGDRDGATKTLELSKSNAKRCNDAYRASDAYLAIAMAEAQMGNYDAAKITTAQIGETFGLWKLKAYLAIAVAQANAGDMAGAKATFQNGKAVAAGFHHDRYWVPEVCFAIAKTGDHTAKGDRASRLIHVIHDFNDGPRERIEAYSQTIEALRYEAPQSQP